MTIIILCTFLQNVFLLLIIIDLLLMIEFIILMMATL